MKSKIQEYQKNNFRSMSKNIILVLFLILAALSAESQEIKNKNAKYVTEVNGNCEQCQKRIQKAAYAVSGVKSAVWSIETHQLDLLINEEKTSLLEVKKAIAKAGYDTDEVKSSEENYEKLPSCCKYERK